MVAMNGGEDDVEINYSFGVFLVYHDHHWSTGGGGIPSPNRHYYQRSIITSAIIYTQPQPSLSPPQPSLGLPL